MQELTNSQLAAQLRALADIYEAHEEIALPYEFTKSTMAIYCHDKETFSATVKALGSGSKLSDEDTVSFVPDAFPKVRVTTWHSDICQRVVVGTREVPEQVIPPTEGHIIPAHTEEIVEWRCTPFLETKEAA